MDSAIPGIGDTILVTTKQFTAASFHIGSKENKGESHPNVCVGNFKSGKGDPKLQVSSGLNENLSINGGDCNEQDKSQPSLLTNSPSACRRREVGLNSISPASAGKRRTEPPAWGQDSGDAKGNEWKELEDQYFLIAACG